MPKSVIVAVSTDAKPNGSDSLDILLVSTEGAKECAVYRDLEVIKKDFPDKKVASMAAALFNQGKTTLADTLIRKVKIVGFEPPENAAALIANIEALREKDNDFYMVLTDQVEDSYITALAAWAESTEPTEAELGAGVEDHRKLYFGQTTNKKLAVRNRRSILIYCDPEKVGEYADAAYLGNVGPFYPESVTWKFKRPDGISVPDLTEAERDALEEANINFLTVEYKREFVKEGVCADGEFIDVQMGADHVAKTMREKLYDIFLSNGKIDYGDEGFAIVASGVFQTLNEATSLGIIATDPESKQGVFTVKVPKFADATEDQIKKRVMPDITWEAQIEGAVHSSKVKGVLRATLK